MTEALFLLKNLPPLSSERCDIFLCFHLLNFQRRERRGGRLTQRVLPNKSGNYSCFFPSFLVPCSSFVLFREQRALREAGEDEFSLNL